MISFDRCKQLNKELTQLREQIWDNEFNWKQAKNKIDEKKYNERKLDLMRKAKLFQYEFFAEVFLSLQSEETKESILGHFLSREENRISDLISDFDKIHDKKYSSFNPEKLINEISECMNYMMHVSHLAETKDAKATAKYFLVNENRYLFPEATTICYAIFDVEKEGIEVAHKLDFVAEVQNELNLENGRVVK